MHLVGYDWAPFGVDMATMAEPELKRYAEDTHDYVWQQGASVVAESVAQNKPTLIRPEHALHVLEIIEAARKSQKTGQRITLNSTFKFPVV
jgi:predicted dehydrogenase